MLLIREEVQLLMAPLLLAVDVSERASRNAALTCIQRWMSWHGELSCPSDLLRARDYLLASGHAATVRPDVTGWRCAAWRGWFMAWLLIRLWPWMRL